MYCDRNNTHTHVYLFFFPFYLVSPLPRGPQASGSWNRWLAVVWLILARCGTRVTELECGLCGLCVLYELSVCVCVSRSIAYSGSGWKRKKKKSRNLLQTPYFFFLILFLILLFHSFVWVVFSRTIQCRDDVVLILRDSSIRSAHKYVSIPSPSWQIAGYSVSLHHPPPRLEFSTRLGPYPRPNFSFSTRVFWRKLPRSVRPPSLLGGMVRKLANGGSWSSEES